MGDTIVIPVYTKTAHLLLNRIHSYLHSKSNVRYYISCVEPGDNGAFECKSAYTLDRVSLMKYFAKYLKKRCFTYKMEEKSAAERLTDMETHRCVGVVEPIPNAWLFCLYEYLNSGCSQSVLDKYGMEIADAIVGHPLNPLESCRRNTIKQRMKEVEDEFRKKKQVIYDERQAELEAIQKKYEAMIDAVTDEYNAEKDSLEKELENV